MFFYNEESTEVSEIGGGSTDQYFSNTSLLLKMDSDFSDSSVNNHTVTVNGNASISTTESKFGGGSGYFDGSGDYLSINATEELNFGTQDWTFECWVNITSNDTSYPTIFSNGVSNWTSGNLAFITRNLSSGISSFCFSIRDIWSGAGDPPLFDPTPTELNVWHHFAVVRAGTTLKMFKNGVEVDSTTIADTLQFHFGKDGGLVGGGNWDGANGYLNGNIDDLRFTKGVARYTANFTPPTEAHPTTGPAEIVSTNLVMHLDAGNLLSYQGTGTDWLDLSGNGNNAVLVSSPTYTTTVGGEFSGFGVYGSGGYARIPHNSSISPTSQITFSAWAHADDWSIAINSGPRQIASKTQSGGYSLGADPAGVVGTARIGSSYKTLKSLPSPGWHNLAYTYDGTTITLYIDGASVGTLSSSGNISYASSNALLIGREAGSGTSPQSGFDWPGKVATFMLYDRGLTSAEVLQNFEAEKSRFGL